MCFVLSYFLNGVKKVTANWAATALRIARTRLFRVCSLSVHVAEVQNPQIKRPVSIAEKIKRDRIGYEAIELLIANNISLIWLTRPRMRHS